MCPPLAEREKVLPRTPALANGADDASHAYHNDDGAHESPVTGRCVATEISKPKLRHQRVQSLVVRGGAHSGVMPSPDITSIPDAVASLYHSRGELQVLQGTRTWTRR